MITKEEVLAAQQTWGEAVVEIGQLYQDKKDFVARCKEIIETLYGYDERTVLFKPTLASKAPFRLSFEGAVSYFVANNKSFDEDNGFALKPWTNVRFENAGFVLKEEEAVTMGNYYFTDLSGEEKKVEYTLGFFRSENGSLKICLHHSSLPYTQA